MSDLLRLLNLIGLDEVAISTQPPGGAFGLSFYGPADQAAQLALQCDGYRSVWFGVHQLAAHPQGGRGKDSDITSVRCLPCDLDDKSLPRAAQAQVILELSAILGEAASRPYLMPAAIVESGGGQQPYWLIEPTDPQTGKLLLDAWKVVVQDVALKHGGTADAVFDLARVLRAPGPRNLKPEYGPDGAPTSVRFPTPPADTNPDSPCLSFPVRLSVSAVLTALISYEPTSPQAPSASNLERSSTPDVTPGTGTPLDDFENRTTWPEILEPHGARIDHTDSDRTVYWTRPGKNEGVSATTGHAKDRDRMLVFTSNWPPFIQGELVTKQGAWAKLNNLTMSEAARYLASKGYGAPRHSSWADDLPVSASHRSINESGPNAYTSPPAVTSSPPTLDVFDPDYAPDMTGHSLPHPGLVPTSAAELEACYLPEDFWTSRPVFGVLRQAAHVAMQSPEGVLVAVLGLTVAHVMPNIVLPACVGVEASLNMMTVTVGSSGDGKSVCRKIAKKTLDFVGVEPVHVFPPSSGQGISAQYQQLRKPKGGEPFMEPLRWNAFAMVEESDKISALTKSTGSTLSSELRAAAMGEIIGAGNMGDTKTNMAEGTYRFVLGMCLQPEQAAWILEEQYGGLPQRFLFACVADGRVVLDAVLPGTWPVRIPLEATSDPVSGAPRSYRVMGVTDAICAEIRNETIERKRRRGMGFFDDAHDGHGTLLRLKVAGALALLDGRLDISDEDWALAKLINEASRATIAWIKTVLLDQTGRRTEASRKVKVADARAIKAAETETVEQAAERRTREAIKKKLTINPGMAKSDLRRSMAAALREHFELVVFEMEKNGELRFENITKNDAIVGSRWFLL